MMSTIRKFFTNKIESSSPEWGDYLLEIADIFSQFDGEPLDREALTERFTAISGRSPYALRDVANFRDEFGAYGTYLGIYHVKKHNDTWHMYMSKAAKYFLCSTEPDIEAFCRSQLSLFQYPNGAGCVYRPSGTIQIQNNILIDTLREIQNDIRLNPLRMVCRIVITMHEHMGMNLDEIYIPYLTLFAIFNDKRVNSTYTPCLYLLREILNDYHHKDLNTSGLTNFKRNFHILERTGLFKRTKKRMENGFRLNLINIDDVYKHIKIIGTMTSNFLDFEHCYSSSNQKCVESVISSPSWGEYYDALNIPMNILIELSDNIELSHILASEPFNLENSSFPELQEYDATPANPYVLSSLSDPYEIMVKREKANREHARILNLLAANLRAKGFSVKENLFVDLYINMKGQPYIFEVKTNTTNNTLSQIRKAISQLYEYRYRSKQNNAILCLVLQNKPTLDWIVDYLINDRQIMVCWLLDDLTLDCPKECSGIYKRMGLI